MTGAFAIRRCDASDASTLASLGARLFTETYSPTHPEPELSRYLSRSFAVEDVSEAISDSEVSMYLVEDSLGVPIAYAYLRATSDPPDGVAGRRPFEIVRFYVDAALMDACSSDARQRGADVIWLQVWKEAPWAVGFYKRMGFSVVGSAPFYFGDQVGDDHIMSRQL